MNWTVKQTEDEGIELIDPTDGKICAVIVGCTPEAQRLIAAAPELLEALKNAEQRIAALSPEGYTAPELWEIRRAIAKAEGRD